MTRRKDDDDLVCVGVSRTERITLDAMRRAAGATSDANLLRIALWSLAEHLEVAMTNDVFEQRDYRGRHHIRRPNPKIRLRA
jgi:hypothetical protein